MKRVLILGATGQIAQWVARGLGQHEGVQQTLLLRNPRKLSGEEPNNAQVVIGDALDKKLLRNGCFDVVGYYNRFDIFGLSVRRREQAPAEFMDIDDGPGRTMDFAAIEAMALEDGAATG